MEASIASGRRLTNEVLEPNFITLSRVVEASANFKKPRTFVSCCSGCPVVLVEAKALASVPKHQQTPALGAS